MKQDTINNQETSNLLKGACYNCGNVNTLERVYELQECVKCGENAVLPVNYEEVIKITTIKNVQDSYLEDGIYTFELDFTHENEVEIGEFLTKEGCYYTHSIFYEVEFRNGVFNFKNVKYGIDEKECDFSKEELLTIKYNVIKYIIDNNLGKIKDLDKILLEKVCEYYGCGLTISNNSVVLDEFVNAEVKTVSDALILFYEDFLKDDWCNNIELKYIENLIEEKAYKVVNEWLDAYSYKVIERKKENGDLTLIVEDLDSVDENHILENTLSYWCKDFINEIYSKNVDEEIREEWIEKDVKPMQSYLNIRKSINKDSKCIDKYCNSLDDNSNETNIIDSYELNSNLEIKLSLEIKDRLYIIHSNFPIVIINEMSNAEFINKFYFSKNTGSFKLVYCENVDGHKINKRRISMFANMDSSKFINSCLDLCEKNASSYIEYNNQKYQVNNIIDFLKLESLTNVSLNNIKLSLDKNEQFSGFILKHLNEYSEGSFGDMLYRIKDSIIFHESMEVVARKYSEQVLGLNATQLKYMDYLSYFIEEVPYEEVDDYIVVYIKK